MFAYVWEMCFKIVNVWMASFSTWLFYHYITMYFIFHEVCNENVNLFFVRSLKRYYVQCNGFIFSWYLLAIIIKGLWRKENKLFFKLGFVAGPVFQANGRLSFVDDLRSGGLKWTSIRTELANSMVTLGERTQGWLGVGERVIWSIGYIQQLKALLGNSSGICWWVSKV